MPVKKKTIKSVSNKSKRISEPTRVSYADAVRSYWLGYVKFSGVSSRAQYWYAFLFVYLINFVFNIIGVKPLSFLIIVLLFLPSRAVAFRRFHDAGLSGWWYLAPMLFFMIWASIRRGTWLFMSNLEVFPADLGIFAILATLWMIFCLIIFVQPSKKTNNKYRK